MEPHSPKKRKGSFFPILIIICLVSICFLLFSSLSCTYLLTPTPTDKPFSVAQNSNTKTFMPYMKKLSNQDTFIGELDRLYHKYGAEIAAYRPEMREWCQVTKSCKFGDYEAEMLFMLVREHKPQNVFEMAPNRGF